jgi:hypothetical protein
LVALSVALGILLAPALAIWACGESPLTPGARVAAVLTSRDSISFEIGDSVLVQADARDAMGNTVLEARIDWRSLDPGVATVHPNDRLAQVIATAAGSGAVVASAGAHDATIALTVLPSITATTLAVHTDTAWALGDQLAIGFTSQSATGPRFGHYTVVSRSNVAAAYLVDLASHEVTIYAQQLGETWVVVTERHGSADSLLFVVRQRPARVRISANPFQGFVGRSFALTAQVTDARNNPIAGQTVSWSSLDTAIARVDSSGLVSFRAVDTTAIVATHASGLADTARAFVLPQPKLGLFNLAVGHSHDSLTVGVHELADTFYAYATDGVSPWVHLRVVDTSIATAADSVRYVGDGGTFQVRGRRPGRTLLIGEAPLMDPDTVRVHVLPSRLALIDYVEPAGFVLLGTDNAHYTAIPLDSAGTPHPLADTLVVTFHSSDSTVLHLTSDPFIGTYPPGVPSLPAFPAHAADTGRAVIYATAPGFTQDSMVWRVLAGPKLHFTQDRSFIIGAKQLAPDAGLGTIGPVTPGDTVTATLTNSNPASLTLPGTVTFSCCTAIGLYASVHLDIALPGVDTVIATAPGHEPDTAVITVTTPRFLLPDTLRVTTLGGFTEVVAGDSLGTPHPPAVARTLLATSSDTTVVRGSSILFPAAYDGWTLLLPAADTTGVATVTVSDSAGLYPPKSMTVVVTLDTSLLVIVNDGYEYGAVATGQRFEDSRFLLTHADVGTTPRTVHLATTVPGVLRVPDSIVVTGSGYVYFPSAGGDTPGTTRIVASTHGFRPDTSAPVVVGQGHLVLRVPDTAFVGGTGYSATVTAQSPTGVELPMDVNLAATLVPLDAGIAPQNPTATVPAGQAVSPPTVLAITAAGSVRFAVLDQRAVPAPFTGDTVTVTVQPPWLRLSSLAYGPALTVGVGQRLDAAIARPGNVVAAAAVVSVTRQGSRTVSEAGGTLTAGAAAAAYTIDGRAIGSDTLTLAAPGYAPDTVEVMVTDGSVEALNWPALLRAGDSVPILLQAYDATRISHRVTARTTFTMQTNGGLTFSDGAQAISAISIAADSATTPVFYVKGTTAGSASVWFVNVDYLQHTYQTTVVARPLASGQRVR